MRLLLPIIVLLTIASSAGCGGFYGQAVRGHMDVMSKRQPIAEVLLAPDTSEDLQRQLALVLEARQFASSQLDLPDNDSYTTYVALDRDYVVWNVFATPEFSVEPRQWCFPVAGCVVYRGYFAQADANAYAGKLADQGFDVYVGGVAAYSTLGRFDDPVLSTMMSWDDDQLIAILFHELAHQRLYVKDDSQFNEGFATAVEELGMARWFEGLGDAAGYAAFKLKQERSRAFNLLLSNTREHLAEIYRGGEDDTVMAQLKAQEFEGLERRYQALRRSWNGYAGYDRWFASPINNARFVPVSTYGRLVPAFRALFRQSGEDFAAFYAACEELADLAPAQRQAKLDALLAISSPTADSQLPESGTE
ncbi:MAG: aminopeptidase [Gammaproteobacteria bacterium]